MASWITLFVGIKCSGLRNLLACWDVKDVLWICINLMQTHAPYLRQMMLKSDIFVFVCLF